MVRDSFQRGSVRSRETKRKGTVWELRYRIRDESCETGWRDVTETAPPQCKTRKEALKLLSEKLAEINRQDSLVSSSSPASNSITFAEFVESDWRSYVENRRQKPSTLYGYESMINNYLLPEFGRRPLNTISPVDLTSFFEKGAKREAKEVSAQSLFAAQGDV